MLALWQGRDVVAGVTQGAQLAAIEQGDGSSKVRCKPLSGINP
jgi:hypothetical protein